MALEQPKEVVHSLNIGVGPDQTADIKADIVKKRPDFLFKTAFWYENPQSKLNPSLSLKVSRNSLSWGLIASALFLSSAMINFYPWAVVPSR